MATISLNNYTTDYMPSYYNNNQLVTKVLRQYSSCYISRSYVRPNQYISNFNLDGVDFYMRTNGASYTSSYEIDIFIEDNDNGTDYLNTLINKGYEPYVQINYLPTNDQYVQHTNTYYWQADMLEGSTVLHINWSTDISAASASITFGYRLSESAQREYLNNYVNIYFEDGYQTGYDAGVTDTNPMQGGINLMSTYWQGMTSLMDHQIMPGLTIGGFVSIPLIITAIIVIFKIVK